MFRSLKQNLNIDGEAAAAPAAAAAAAASTATARSDTTLSAVVGSPPRRGGAPEEAGTREELVALVRRRAERIQLVQDRLDVNEERLRCALDELTQCRAEKDAETRRADDAERLLASVLASHETERAKDAAERAALQLKLEAVASADAPTPSPDAATASTAAVPTAAPPAVAPPSPLALSAEFEEERRRLEREIDLKTRELAAARSLVETMQRTAKERESLTVRLKAAAAEELERVVQRKDDEMARLREDLTRASTASSADRDALNTRHSAETRRLEGECERLRTRLTETQGEAAVASTLRETVHTLQRDLDEAHAQADQLARDLAVALNTERDDDEEQLALIQQLRNRVRELDAEVAQLRDELDTAATERISDQEEHTRALRVQQQRIVDLTKTLQKELRSNGSTTETPTPPPAAAAAAAAAAPTEHTRSPSFHNIPLTDPSPAPPPTTTTTTTTTADNADTDDDINMDYLKCVVLNYICAGDTPSQSLHLVRALSTLLRFTRAEKKRVNAALVERHQSSAWFPWSSATPAPPLVKHVSSSSRR